MLERFQTAFPVKGILENINIVVWDLSNGVAFWTRDGCIEAAQRQSSEALLTVDMITGKLLGFLEELLTKRTSNPIQDFLD